MLNFVMDEVGKIATLKLEGEISIQNAEELKQNIERALSTAKYVEINLENASGFDVTFLQILVSAFRTSLEMERNLTLTINPSEEFRKIVKISGFEYADWN